MNLRESVSPLGRRALDALERLRGLERRMIALENENFSLAHALATANLNLERLEARVRALEKEASG